MTQENLQQTENYGATGSPYATTYPGFYPIVPCPATLPYWALPPMLLPTSPVLIPMPPAPIPVPPFFLPSPPLLIPMPQGPGSMPMPPQS